MNGPGHRGQPGGEKGIPGHDKNNFRGILRDNRLWIRFLFHFPSGFLFSFRRGFLLFWLVTGFLGFHCDSFFRGFRGCFFCVGSPGFFIRILCRILCGTVFRYIRYRCFGLSGLVGGLFSGGYIYRCVGIIRLFRAVTGRIFTMFIAHKAVHCSLVINVQT